VLQTLARALIGRPDTRTASARRFAEELNADLELLGVTPVQIRVDGPVAGPPPPAHLAPGAPYETQSGFTTTTARAGYARGQAGRPPGASAPPQVQGTPWPQPQESTGTVMGLQTGYVSTHHAYRQPEQPAHRAVGQRKRVPKLAIAGGGGLLLVILAVAYLLAAPKHPAANRAAATTSTSPSASVPAVNAAPVPPPQDVTAVVLSDTSVRLSWKNDGPHGRDAQVIITMGSEYKPRPLPNQSPQVITGLSPTQPYCFAVGYYVGSGPVNVSYSKVTDQACIRGGKPAASG
jgi:hypothetical protein